MEGGGEGRGRGKGERGMRRERGRGTREREGERIWKNESEQWKTVTMSFAKSCWSLMMNIISNRDNMVGMKSMFYKGREERVQCNGSPPLWSPNRIPLCVVPASVYRISSCKYRAPWVEGGGYTSLDRVTMVTTWWRGNGRERLTLAMDMVCCSMASWMATRSSSLIWEGGGRGRGRGRGRGGEREGGEREGGREGGGRGRGGEREGS